MAATYTCLQLIKQVYRGVLQPDTGNDRLDPAADHSLVLEYLRRGQRQFARDTECYARDVTIAAVDEQHAYAVPVDVWRIRQVYYGSQTTPLEGLTYPKFIEKFPNFRSTDAGTPLYWTRQDARNLWLYPKPSVTAATNLTLDALILPSTLTTAAGYVAQLNYSPTGPVDTVPEVRDEHLLAAVQYAIVHLIQEVLTDEPQLESVLALAQTRYLAYVMEENGLYNIESAWDTDVTTRANLRDVSVTWTGI